MRGVKDVRQGLFQSVLTGPSTRTSHAQVVHELGKAIVGGEFPIGSILPGDPELALRFKVSRTVLREAMKTLAAKGLIIPRARIGTRVTPKTHWNLFDSEVLAWHFDKGVEEGLPLPPQRNPPCLRAACRGPCRPVCERTGNQQHDAARRGHGGGGAHAETLAYADLKFIPGRRGGLRQSFHAHRRRLIEAALVGIFKCPRRWKARTVSTRSPATISPSLMKSPGVDEAGARLAMERVIRVGRDRVKATLARG